MDILRCCLGAPHTCSRSARSQHSLAQNPYPYRTLKESKTAVISASDSRLVMGFQAKAMQARTLSAVLLPPVASSSCTPVFCAVASDAAGYKSASGKRLPRPMPRAAAPAAATLSILEGQLWRSCSCKVVCLQAPCNLVAYACWCPCSAISCVKQMLSLAFNNGQWAKGWPAVKIGSVQHVHVCVYPYCPFLPLDGIVSSTVHQSVLQALLECCGAGQVCIFDLPDRTVAEPAALIGDCATHHHTSSIW